MEETKDSRSFTENEERLLAALDVACERLQDGEQNAIEEVRDALWPIHRYCKYYSKPEKPPRHVWEYVCNVYPYENTKLNLALTEYFRNLPDGIALLQSLFCEEYVSFCNGVYSSFGRLKYSLQKDEWIGRLYCVVKVEDESGDIHKQREYLPFVENDGVEECRYFFTSAPERDDRIHDAVDALLSIYEFCETCATPDEMWRAFGIIFGKFADDIDGEFYPYFGNVADSMNLPHVYLGALRGLWHYSDRKAKEYIAPTSECFAELFANCGDQIAKFIQNITSISIIP